MRHVRLALVAVIAVVLAACSGGGGDSSPAAPSSPTDAASAPAVPTRVEVQLADAMTIEPATMSVPAGEPVTFVVTNTGAIEHEFFLGDEAAQAEHEQEMAEMGGMGHDEEMGIAVDPGATKELTVTFPEAGTILAGCHVPGHYPAGMKATVEITD